MADQQILPFYGHMREPSRSSATSTGTTCPTGLCCRTCPSEFDSQYSEKATMGVKAALFEDQERDHRFIDESYMPDDTKALGRKVRNLKEDVWTNVSRRLLSKWSIRSSTLPMIEEVAAGDWESEAVPNDRIWMDLGHGHWLEISARAGLAA
eukprot:Skav212572  [mRNA]  locus=scaffold125:261367:261822:- [translate_table: standard]